MCVWRVCEARGDLSCSCYVVLWLPWQHDVTEFNYVSRTYDKALVLTTVDHVSFSTDGSWMATVRTVYHNYYHFDRSRAGGEQRRS